MVRAKFFISAQVAYVLNLLPPRDIEPLDRPDQRHVSVADKFEEVLRRPHVPLGDRDHQPKVGTDNLALDRDRLVVQLLDPVH